MDYLVLLGLIGSVAAAASTGAMYGPGDWYEQLDKPSWTPPNWLFPLAWTALYILMIWAAYRVATSGHPAMPAALAMFGCQIALNAIWSPMFFGLRRLGTAMIGLIFLWLAVAMTMLLFFRVDLLAGLMFVPYLVWGSYAGALNYDIWQRNRSAA